MENSFNIISSTASSCGSCHTTGCGTCAPAPPKVERTNLVSRRDLGRAALVSAGAILAGCSSQQRQPPKRPLQRLPLRHPLQTCQLS